MKVKIVEVENWEVVEVSERELKNYELASVNFCNISGLFRNAGDTKIYFDADMDDNVDVLERLIDGLEDGSILEDGYGEVIDTLYNSCKDMIRKIKNERE